MTQNQQFLQDFENSMNKLNGMNEKIQNSLKQKKDFSDKLLAKLRDVNERIKGLAGQINKLKEDVATLQGQVSNNSSSITGKDAQILELTQKLNALEAEKQQISQQYTEFQRQVNDEKNALQQTINADEEKIRQLTDENTNIKNQADALTSELSGKGDLQAQHAEQLKAQTEDFQRQLAAQQQANQTKIDELMSKIKECDDKMLELQTQLQQKTDEAAAHVQSINDAQNQGQTQVAQLTQQIEELKTENNDLIQRIIGATKAIQQATSDLETLVNYVPNQQTDDEMEQLFSEIQLSIQNISSAIQGNPISANTAPIQRIQPNEEITLQDVATGSPVQIQYNSLLQQLKNKSSQIPGDNKYKKALQQLKTAQNPQDVATILSRNDVTFKNNAIMGGRKTKKMNKTKKMRKQKGGYTYKASAKRQSITTTSSARSSARGRGVTKRTH